MSHSNNVYMWVWYGTGGSFPFNMAETTNNTKRGMFLVQTIKRNYKSFSLRTGHLVGSIVVLPAASRHGSEKKTRRVDQTVSSGLFHGRRFRRLWCCVMMSCPHIKDCYKVYAYPDVLASFWVTLTERKMQETRRWKRVSLVCTS